MCKEKHHKGIKDRKKKQILCAGVSKVKTTGKISDYVKNVTKSSSNSPWTRASQAVGTFPSYRRPAGLAHYGIENALLNLKVREGLVQF